MLPFVLFESFDRVRNPRSYRFENPVGEIVALDASEIVPALHRIEGETARGRHCAGFLSYEAAPGLDTALKTRPPSALPLLWFGVFENRREITPGDWGDDGTFSLHSWTSSIDRATYDDAVHRIRDYIAAGDTYQVNFTFRRFAAVSGSLPSLYRTLCRAQGAGYCAWVDLGRHVILSASPEVFFRVDGRDITTRPMKGTSPRGRWSEEDDAVGHALAESPKNRAENLMIVDLMRNDLGRIVETGSVRVPDLFTLERYETLWQLTSTVQGRLRDDIRLADLLRALFPSGSVTGAPKIHTMELIRDLESTPRGVYTGCIGYVSPRQEMLFNVAIRTVVVDREAGRAEFGVGGGITFDSAAAAEFEECEVKTRFLLNPPPEFQLLESMRYEPAAGYFLLDRHLARLRGSARYFGFSVDLESVKKALLAAACSWAPQAYKVRLLVDRRGAWTIEQDPIGPPDPLRVLRTVLAPEPVDSRDPFLYHKTTHRAVYDTRAAASPDADDVILVNQRGEVTESCRANVVVDLNGRRYTPPVHAGLLPGTFRAELLARGEITERTITPEDLGKAERLFLINSVRGWMPARVTGSPARE